MSWAMAAQAGLQVLGAAQSAKSAASQSIAENKATQAYNTKVQVQTLEAITQINLQRAQDRQDSAAALYNVRQQGMTARDAVTQQAAATDTIGASVDDAVSARSWPWLAPSRIRGPSRTRRARRRGP